MQDDMRLVTRWQRHAVKLLLAFFVLNQGEPIYQSRLCKMVFLNVESGKCIKSLKSRISELRHILDPHLNPHDSNLDQFIRRVGKGIYQFRQDAPCRLDTQQVVDFIQAGRREMRTQRWAQAQTQYEAVLGLYRGELLCDEGEVVWLTALRQHYERLRLEAVMSLTECHVQRKNIPQAIATLEQTLSAGSPAIYAKLIELYKQQNRPYLAQSIYQQFLMQS